MNNMRAFLFTVVELILFSYIGFYFTEYILRPMYETVGVSFTGNRGIIWLAMTFFLFCLYTIIRTKITSKQSYLLSDRLISIAFWIIFIGSILMIILPFITGKIPA